MPLSFHRQTEREHFAILIHIRHYESSHSFLNFVSKIILYFHPTPSRDDSFHQQSMRPLFKSFSIIQQQSLLKSFTVGAQYLRTVIIFIVIKAIYVCILHAPRNTRLRERLNWNTLTIARRWYSTTSSSGPGLSSHLDRVASHPSGLLSIQSSSRVGRTSHSLHFISLDRTALATTRSF